MRNNWKDYLKMIQIFEEQNYDCLQNTYLISLCVKNMFYVISTTHLIVVISIVTVKLIINLKFIFNKYTRYLFPLIFIWQFIFADKMSLNEGTYKIFLFGLVSLFYFKC